MKIAVIDDEKTQADILIPICKAYFKDEKADCTIEYFSDGHSFVDKIKSVSYDIAFIDIFMTPVNGIELSKMLRKADRNIIIVFVTTSPDFMMQAFSVHAFHYITKPYSAEQINKVLDDAELLMNKNTKYVEIMCDRKINVISLNEIISVESDAHYLNITVVSGVCYRTRLTVAKFLELCDEDPRLITVNRGVVLNADYIKSVDGTVCIMGNGERFPIKVREKSRIENSIRSYIFNKIRENQRRIK